MSFFLHRIPDHFSQGQENEFPNSHSAIMKSASKISRKLISSQTKSATSHRQSDRRADCQQAVRHTTSGTLRNSKGFEDEVGKEKRGEGEAKTDDYPKLTEAQQLHTLQPNKSFTRGKTFTNACCYHSCINFVLIICFSR